MTSQFEPEGTIFVEEDGVLSCSLMVSKLHLYIVWMQHRHRYLLIRAKQETGYQSFTYQYCNIGDGFYLPTRHNICPLKCS